MEIQNNGNNECWKITSTLSGLKQMVEVLHTSFGIQCWVGCDISRRFNESVGFERLINYTVATEAIR